MEEEDLLLHSLGFVELALVVLSMTFPNSLKPSCKPESDSTELRVEAGWRLGVKVSSLGHWNGHCTKAKCPRK